ncbi:hypothetical protein [Rhodonellum sp.]|uniref:hypothetical protein n=1 Tax=Rhodonellum sp. TaxID=2231180 RepID=UPI0027245568|nr:hypothetical protein [Rhodonellum sp.]MDO9553857.1 hypothetical protein [Rhodonellum sp.]
MKRFNVLGNEILVSSDYIQYKKEKILLKEIQDWELDVSVVHFSTYASLMLITKNNSLIIDSSATFKSNSKIQEGINNLYLILEEILTEQIIMNFINNAVNKIKLNGSYTHGGLKFTKDFVSTGLLFPLSVPYNDASINASQMTAYNGERTEVYLNNGFLDNEKRIKTHLSSIKIQKLKILLKYLPNYL